MSDPIKPEGWLSCLVISPENISPVHAYKHVHSPLPPAALLNCVIDLACHIYLP